MHKINETFANWNAADCFRLHKTIGRISMK